MNIGLATFQSLYLKTFLTTYCFEVSLVIPRSQNTPVVTKLIPSREKSTSNVWCIFKGWGKNKNLMSLYLFFFSSTFFYFYFFYLFQGLQVSATKSWLPIANLDFIKTQSWCHLVRDCFIWASAYPPFFNWLPCAPTWSK